MSRREFLARTGQSLVLACGLPAAIPAAFAQEPYPSRPIRFIVPFPPGGGTDILSRLVASRIAALRGWNITIDNLPGAGGMVGVSAISRAEPNGYTIGMGTVSTLTINPNLTRSIPFDAARDITPVSLVSITPQALVVPAGSQANTVAEIIAMAKARPGALNYGSAGNGSSHQLSAEWLSSLSGIKMTHVPYTGSAAAVTGLVRSDTQLMFIDLPAVLPMVRAGRLKALAVTSAQRVPPLANVPTMAETVPGFEMGLWYSIVAPASTPRGIVDTLNRAVRDVVAAPEFRKHFSDEGALAQSSTPEELSQLIRTESVRWAALIKATGMTAQ